MNGIGKVSSPKGHFLACEHCVYHTAQSRVHQQLTRGRPKAGARDLSRGIICVSALPTAAPKACLLITP